jgi:hypothetical protein
MWENCGETGKTKIPKLLLAKGLNFCFVVSPGIEPGTQGFSVLCSTN